MSENAQNKIHDQLFNGLKALAETSFPKTCADCGRIYRTAEQFLRETAQVRITQSELKETAEDDGLRYVEVFRNCSCGSTLMDLFGNRRDNADAGAESRKRFDALMEILAINGLDSDAARNELLKVMRGEHSAVLDRLRPSRKNP